MHTHVACTIRLFFQESVEQKYRKAFNRLNRKTFRKKFLDTNFLPEIIFYRCVRRVIYFECARGILAVYICVYVLLRMCVCVRVCVGPSSLRVPLGHPSGPATRRDCADVRASGAGQWEAPRIVSRRHAALQRRQPCRRRRRKTRTT